MYHNKPIVNMTLTEKASPFSYDDFLVLAPFAGYPAKSAGIPAKFEGIPAKSAGIPASVHLFPAKSAGIPAKFEGIPAKSAGIPAKSAGIPAKFEGIPAGTLVCLKGLAIRTSNQIAPPTLIGERSNMEKGHDFIPAGDEDFYEWSRNFVEGVEANAEVLGAPASEVTTLRTQFNDYETKLRVAKSGNRGKADVVKKNEAKKVLMRTERLMNKLYIAWNPNVDDALRKVLGVTVRNVVRTPIPEPKTRPEFSFKVLDIMRIQIGFHEQGSASRAIPYGYNGAVFCYIVADTPVTDYKLLTNSILLTYSPWTLVLPPDAEGKVLSGAMMWQNGKGEKGPWSEIQSIIVP